MALSSQARVDWKIIRVVSEVVDEKLPYDKLPELRARMAEVAYKHTSCMIHGIYNVHYICLMTPYLELGLPSSLDPANP